MPTHSRLTLLIALAAVVLGLALRLWYLFHVPTNSDEAIVGLMAQQILHGHFSAFYWGQPYGGGEPYVVAVLFALFGQSALVLGIAPVLLSAVAAVLTWRVVLRLVRQSGAALVAGALVWVGPDTALANSTREYGFRGVTMVCGLACLLLALRILDGQASHRDTAALGLVAGVGWWSSPEIVYFIVPAGLIVLGALCSGRHDLRFWLPRIATGVAAAVVGALPWLWANVHSHLASLKPSSFPGGAVTSLNTGYADRLKVFWRLSLPIELNLKELVSGIPVIGHTGASTTLHLLGALAVVVVCAALVITLLLCLARGGRWAALGVAVVVFPFLFAAQPGTWYWSDGRYVVFVGPLLAIVLVAGGSEAARRLRGMGGTHRANSEASVPFTTMILVVGMALSLAAFCADNGVRPHNFTSGWGDPNRSAEQALTTFEHHGLRAAFADYWVAYKADLLDGQHLEVTPVPGDVDRSRAIDRRVDAATPQAWLFVPPSQFAAAITEFTGGTANEGPGGQQEVSFVAALKRMGVPYRVVRGGILDAVVPARNLTIAQVRQADG